MKQTIGMDLADIEDFRKLATYRKKSWKQIFSEKECSYAASKTHPEIHFAGCFAAKEAVVKALNSNGLNYRLDEIEIVHSAEGIPIALLRRNNDSISISLSITHTKNVAAAVALVTYLS